MKAPPPNRKYSCSRNFGARCLSACWPSPTPKPASPPILQSSPNNAANRVFNNEKLICIDLTEQERFAYDTGEMFCVNNDIYDAGRGNQISGRDAKFPIDNLV